MASCVRCSGSGVVMMPAADWGIHEGLPVPCLTCDGTGVAIDHAPPVRVDREALARVAFDAFYAAGTPYTEVEAAIFGQVVDAVLARVMP